MIAPAENRRLTQRHNIGVPLKYRLWRSGVQEALGRSVNISEAGIYFATHANVDRGEIIEVRFKMPEAVANEPPAEWLCTGKVVRVDRGKNVRGVGVRFDCYEVARPLGTTTIYEAESLLPRYSLR